MNGAPGDTCLGTEFEPFETADYRGWVRSCVAKDALEELLEGLPSMLENQPPIRVDQTGTRFSYRCRLKAPAVNLYLKVIHPKGVLRALTVDLVFGSLATIAARNSLALERAGIPTPPVYVVMEDKAPPTRRRGYVFTREADPFVFIETFLHLGTDAASAAGKASRIAAFAAFIRRMHERGIFHFDLSNYNILVRARGSGYEFELLDLDYMVTVPNTGGAAARLCRLIDLVIMNAMFKDTDFSRLDKLRFLKHYFGKDFKRIMRTRTASLLLEHSRLGAAGWVRRIILNLPRLMLLCGAAERPAMEEGKARRTAERRIVHGRR